MADDARRLIADGRFVDAMDVLEAGAEPTQESLFWINLLDAARYLGYADRATTFYRRYRLSSPKVQTHRVVEETVRSDCSVSEGMRRVIGQCAKTTPDPGWDQFAHLPLDTELARLGKWLTALLSREPPPFEIGALRFGLVNIDRRGLPSADMYLAGVVQDDDDPEWALGPSSWEPTEPYGHSEVLAQIYRLSCAGDVF